MTEPITTIEQRIAAGNPWNGAVPTTTPVDDDQGLRKFPVDVVGGLFTFDFVGPDDIYDQCLIERILVDFGTSVTGQVYIVNRDAIPRQVLIATVGGGVYQMHAGVRLTLAWDERIQLISIGAPAAEMYARVTASPQRMRQ